MRHERAIVLTLAYIIGFTTAYIAFGISTDDAGERIVRSASQSQNVASVMTAMPEPLITTDDVGLDDRGLYVVLDGEEQFVSGILPEGAEPGAGYHVSIDVLSLANDGRLLYYCAQESFEQEGCTEYVYNVAKHSIRAY